MWRQQVLLKGRVAIVTGGAVGIGRGIALKFAGEGCSVGVVDISAAEGEKTARGVVKRGKEGIFIKCDVTDGRQVRDMVSQAIGKFGRIDILVNNAGGVFRGGGQIEEIAEEQWDKLLNLNLKSQFLCCQAVVPYMKERKYGRIINVSSLGAVHPPAPLAHYHAAKGGVLGLTTNLAFELAPYNICVNAILPGPIRTEFYTEILKSVPDKEAFFASLGKRVPLGRMGTPEDIAGVALFLASELSAYVTGESIRVTGGIPLEARDISSS
jgi:NAD(P)-dependent dehydrogenase (short-subunit alcohol dehydrogenase family)